MPMPMMMGKAQRDSLLSILAALVVAPFELAIFWLKVLYLGLAVIDGWLRG
jgi:hypothetical protein